VSHLRCRRDASADYFQPRPWPMSLPVDANASAGASALAVIHRATAGDAAACLLSSDDDDYMVSNVPSI
jgi:hypothetical protein